MGNTDSKKTSEAPSGQHTTAFNNSPSYSVQDGFHLFDHPRRGTDWRSQKESWLWLKRTQGRPTNGDAHLSQTLTGQNGRTTTYFPPPKNPSHQWVDQQALDIRLMEHQHLFRMLFWNVMRAQQKTARVARMPRAQIIEMPVETTYSTYCYRLAKQNKIHISSISCSHR